METENEFIQFANFFMKKVFNQANECVFLAWCFYRRTLATPRVISDLIPFGISQNLNV